MSVATRQPSSRNGWLPQCLRTLRSVFSLGARLRGGAATVLLVLHVARHLLQLGRERVRRDVAQLGRFARQLRYREGRIRIDIATIEAHFEVKMRARRAT